MSIKDNIVQYINTDCLPKNGKNYDWKRSIGCKLDFVYENIHGTIEIIDYICKNNIHYLVFKYKDIIYSLQPSVLLQCAFGRLLKYELMENKYKYNIGEIIDSDKGSFTIIDRFVEKSNSKNGHLIKKYKYKCNKCGYEDVRNENQIGRACMACYKIPRKVIAGINDIPTTAPWMIPYFVGGAEEASNYNARSNKKIFMKCPYCGKITKVKKSINKLYYSKGFLCECSDNISFPNKFSYELLR